MNLESWRTRVTRRAFARSLTGVVAGLAGLPAALRALSQERPDTFSIGIAYGGNDISFRKGVQLGIGEAKRGAALFGKHVQSFSSELESRLSLNSIVEELAARPVQLIVACGTDAQIKGLAGACRRHGVVLFNCCARGDSLRRDLCGGETFHIGASDAMYRDGARISPSAKSIVLWSAALEKYGAAQLNDRFRSFAERPMDGAAWAGWVAVKIAWESFLRAPGSWSANLLSDSTQFDGHKGAPLSFRSWDHQLRQPLYAVGDRVTDVPDISQSSEPARVLLDSIGDRQGLQSCRTGPGT